MSKKLIFFFLILIIGMGFLVFATPSDVGTSSSSQPLNDSFQRKMFYANNRFWIFHSDGTNMVYRTSTDGSTWSSSTTVKTSTTVGFLFSIWFNPNNVKISYVYAYNSLNQPLLFRRGTPNSNGTITWDASEQTVKTANASRYYYSPFVSADSSNYDWIAYSDIQASPIIRRVFILQNANNDGTWSTSQEKQFSYGGSLPKGEIIPLTSGKMLAIIGQQFAVLRVNRWNGTTWDAEVTSNSTLALAEDFQGVSDTDNAHIVFHKQTTNDAVYVKYLSASNSLTTEYNIVTLSPYASVQISATSSNSFIFFWATSSAVWVKPFVSGSWGASTQWFSETFPSNSYWIFSNYERSSNKTFISWKSSSGYVRFNKVGYTATNLTVSDYHVNPSQSLTFSGKLIYTGTSDSPPDGDYQVKIKLLGIQKGSTDTTLVDGLFSIVASAETSVGSYSYTVEFNEMTGTNEFSTVIVDKISLTITPTTTYANVNQTVTFQIPAVYLYDGSPVTFSSLQFTRNGSNYATNRPFTDVRSSSGKWVYTTTTAVDTSYGISSFTTNTVTVTWGFRYSIYGVYNEDTGLLNSPLYRASNVTVYFSDHQTSFIVNGSYTYVPSTKPLYFDFSIKTPTNGTYSRQYWLSPNDVSQNISIFDADVEIYTVKFLDYAGVLKDYPYISAKRSINGTLFTVEKRMIDEELKVVMQLKYLQRYTLTLGDDAEYIFGDVEFGTEPIISLIVKGIDFPKGYDFTYKYLRIYGFRVFGPVSGNITIHYLDTLNKTYSVQLQFCYQNLSVITTYVSTSSSFSYTWSSAGNHTSYWVIATINHQTYGTTEWKQYFPRGMSDKPWGLGFLGSLPFDTAILIPALIIIFVAGCFSVINAYMGVFFTVVVAILLTYMGWIPIPASALVTGFMLAILGVLAYYRKGRYG